MRRFDEEGGGIITGWLVQMVVILALIAVVVYEVVAVVATHVTADDSAREVARAARDAYRVEESIEHAETSADEVAETRDVEIASVTEDDGYLVVVIERQAPTLLVHRIGPIEDLAAISSSSRIRWAS